MNKVLKENIIIYKKLNANIYIYIYKEKIIKIKEQEEIINVDDEEENVNEEIVLQNDK